MKQQPSCKPVQADLHGFNNPAKSDETTTISKRDMERIARRILGIKVLKDRRLDYEDFPDVSLSSIKLALEEAYRLGKRGKQ